jgi:hypothetical protein
MIARLTMIIVANAAVAFSGSPTQPGPGSGSSHAPQTSGYTLAISAKEFATIDGRSVSACPGASAFIVANVTVDSDGSQWRVKAASAADGDFEMTFRDTGQTSTNSRRLLEGSIRGTVKNTMFPPRNAEPSPSSADLSASGSPNALVDAVEQVRDVVVTGRFGGEVTIRTQHGTTGLCAPGTVNWSLNGPRR